MENMWQIVAAERGALAADLIDLDVAGWRTPSLCESWTVQDTLAHMSGTADTAPADFVKGLVGSRFSFQRFSAAGIERYRGDSPAETLRIFRSLQGSTKAPPGPKLAWLGETVVHSEDIRRPLGITHSYPLSALTALADFYKGSNTLIGSKRRIAGLHLRANDTAWEHGSGEVVDGPMLALLLALTGRLAACDDLTGPGVATLRQRG
jgi:uncharacterized protein (TIGR03083 family)